MTQSNETNHPNLKIKNRPQTLREIALGRLRSAIIAGHFPSGDRLVERTLCENLGVSRSVIREVIRHLEAEELVEIIPYSGPKVAHLNWEKAQQIYDIRLLLEVSAVRNCAQIANESTKKELANALQNLESASSNIGSKNNSYAFCQTITNFYQIIFATAKQEIAWDIVQRLNGRISRLRALTLASKDRKTSGPEHMAHIYRAIVENNPEKAEKAVQNHLNEAADTAKKLLALECNASL